MRPCIAWRQTTTPDVASVSLSIRSFWDPSASNLTDATRKTLFLYSTQHMNNTLLWGLQYVKTIPIL